MTLENEIKALQSAPHLREVRAQAAEMRARIEKQSGRAFTPKTAHKGYDLSKRFMPLARPAALKGRLG